MEERYIASIDLGTAKFGLCVARVKGNDVQIVYYKETPSDGIRTSVVANPMKATLPLKAAVREAEEELMIKIMQVVIGMPRNDVQQVTATGKIIRTNPDEYISEEEVESLKSMALEQYPLDDPASQIMYGTVAQSFSIDDQIQLVESDVVGTLSETLEGNFKVFIGSRRATTAVDKVFNSMGIAIAKKYFLPDVVAKTVLSNEDRYNGVALMDIGAGVTSVSIYHRGIMRYYAAIPFGGRTITNDIRTECSISEEMSEKVKLRFGACLPGKLASLSEKVLHIYEGDNNHEVSVKFLSEVIDSRCREIIEAVLWYIQESGLQNNLRGGIVLTGGGANLVNLAGLVKEMSGYEVRTGFPRHLFSTSVGTGVYNPSATSAIGMVLAAKDDRMPDCVTKPEVPLTPFVDIPEPAAEEPVDPGETPFQMPEEALESGTTGELLAPEEFGPAVEPVKERKPRKNSGLRIFWTKLKDGAKEKIIDIYDDYNN
ncbi:MAG: cell division protein FtsA [Bacteroidales bacterium]|nr:cell division protein FtsA [Bacteroidales bacterium]